MFSLPWVITGRFFVMWRRVPKQTSISEVPAPSVIIVGVGRQQVSPEIWQLSTKPDGVTFQKDIIFKRPKPCFSSQNDPHVTSFPRRWRCVLWTSASWLRGDEFVVVFIRNVDTHVPDNGVMSLKSTIWICTLLSVVGQPMVLLSILFVMVATARLLLSRGSRRKRLAELWKWKNAESRWNDYWLTECFL